MTNHEKGKIYEDYIEFVYRLLLDSEAKSNDDPIIISRNVTFIRNGYTDEIDIYYEFTKAKIIHKVAIECKNHSTPIDISSIRNFHAKIRNIQNLTGVVVSNSGFQDGAKKYAEEFSIILMKTSDLPNFMQIIGKRLYQIFLPNEYDKGEPFYVLMEHKKGVLTGSYQVCEENKNKYILLFLSKSAALEYINITKEFDLTPRSLKQEAYDFFILFAKNEKAKLQLVLHKINHYEYFSSFIEPDDLFQFKE
ncbi:MAG: hypothetical protein RLZZ175_3331 [Bacteroidota bacterium]|jgi:hypothetical protein